MLAALSRDEALVTHRLTTIGADAPVRHAHALARRAASAARADPHVRLRLDRVPARPRRQLSPVRPRDVASQLAARDGLRGDARPQHHRRQRQGLRRGRRPGSGAASSPRGRPSGSSRTRTISASGGPTSSRARRRRSREIVAFIEELIERGRRVRGGRRRLLPRRGGTRVRPAVGRAARGHGLAGVERAEARIRATSRSGSRRSRTRTHRGTRRGGRADRAGTSSARRWPRSTSGRSSRSTAAGSTSLPAPRERARAVARARAPLRARLDAQRDARARRREDVEVARATSSRCATSLDALGARDAARLPPDGALAQAGRLLGRDAWSRRPRAPRGSARSSANPSEPAPDGRVGAVRGGARRRLQHAGRARRHARVARPRAAATGARHLRARVARRRTTRRRRRSSRSHEQRVAGARRARLRRGRPPASRDRGGRLGRARRSRRRSGSSGADDADTRARLRAERRARAVPRAAAGARDLGHGARGHARSRGSTPARVRR